jgi:excisionase family DNA binding protein
MATTRERDYVTVAEAAEALDVHQSTVWRWIEAKRLPAYTVGTRKIRIKRGDLALVVTPRSADAVDEGDASPDKDLLRPPTTEELARRKAAVAALVALRPRMRIAPRTSDDLLREARDEREERYRSWSTTSS